MILNTVVQMTGVDGIENLEVGYRPSELPAPGTVLPCRLRPDHLSML